MPHADLVKHTGESRPALVHRLPGKSQHEQTSLECAILARADNTVFMLQGLPQAWQAALKDSGISKDEAGRNPQAVLAVLALHMQGHPPRLPTRPSTQRKITAPRPIIPYAHRKHHTKLKKLSP